MKISKACFLGLSVLSGGICANAIAEDSLLPGVPLHGFADVGYAQGSDPNKPRGYPRGFYLDNLDLYLEPDFGNRVRFLAEVTFEPDQETQEIGVDTERLLLGYVFSNQFSAWVGRFHTPIGYWAMAHQHGGLLQTTIDKPNYFDFEDHFGVVPVHTVGLLVRGDTFVFGDHRLGYMAWVGNGDSLSNDPSSQYGFTGLNFNMLHDDNRDTTYGGRLIWFFGGSLSGLQVGVSGMHQRVDYHYDASGTAPNVQQAFATSFNMMSVHAVYEANGIESINEVSFFKNSDANFAGTPSIDSAAGYSQLAYWIQGKMAPYVRYERGAFNQDDLYFASQYNGLPYGKGLFGFRYNVSDNAAVKLEFSRTVYDANSLTNPGHDMNKVNANYSIRF